MKSSKESNRFEDMMQYYSSRRGGQERGDRAERKEKVTEYLKNLNLEASGDESLSDEEYMEPRSSKKKSDTKYMDVDDVELLKSSLKNMKKGKKKGGGGGGGGGGGEDESESESSYTSYGSLSLSDLTTESSEGNKDPFAFKSKKDKGGHKAPHKIGYEDLGKALEETDDIMDSIRKVGKARGGAAKAKDSPSRPSATSASPAADESKFESRKAIPKEVRAKIDKKMGKLDKTGGDAMSSAFNKMKTQKDDFLSSEGEDGEDSIELDFLKYLQSSKGRKVLENVGKKIDMSPFPDNLFEKSLAEYDEKNKRKALSKLGGANKAQSSRPNATEPPRAVPPNRKTIPRDQGDVVRTPAAGGGNPLKTGAINKVLNKDMASKSKTINMAAKDVVSGKATMPAALSKEARAMASKLESKAAINLLKGEKKPARKLSSTKKQ